MRSILSFVVIVLLVCYSSYVDAHGRLTSPKTRDQVAGVYEYQMNAPTGYSTALVCRGFPKGSSVLSVTAGSTFSFSYTLTALHPGDCFLYVSYDVDTDAASQKWFKILQIAYCEKYSGQTLTATMPSWAKSGAAVLRWEWYALQQVTNTEFYAQCSDITIVGNDNGCTGTPLVTVPGNLPADNANLQNYRLAYEANAPFFFTGPAVATSSCGSGSSSGGSTTTTTAPKATTAPVVRATTSAPRKTTAAPASNLPYCATSSPITTRDTTKHAYDADEEDMEYEGYVEGDDMGDEGDEQEPRSGKKRDQPSAHFDEKASSVASASSSTVVVAALVAGCVGLFSGIGVGLLMHTVLNRKKSQPSVQLTERFVAI